MTQLDDLAGEFVLDALVGEVQGHLSSFDFDADVPAICAGSSRACRGSKSCQEWNQPRRGV